MNMKFKNEVICMLLRVCLIACSSPVEISNYYFDSQTGSDTNAGISPDKLLKSLSSIKELELKPGDSILLKSGGIFPEKLYFSGKRSGEKSVVISKYGGEARPHIKGDAREMQMVHVGFGNYKLS
jgi:hypothetical protein